MTNTETKAEPKKRSWVAPIVTTIITIIITIAVTILATWYTINWSKKQAISAEVERARNVRNSLVSIIEEHVINQKSLDPSTLIRLTEVKSRNEELTSIIIARDLVEQAEYNILSSRYLDFNQKEKYKAVFEDFYKTLAPKEQATYKDVPHAELLNQIASDIRNGKTKVALEDLNRFVEKYSTDWVKLKKGIPPKGPLTEFLSKPPIFYTIAIIYLIYMLFIFSYILKKRTILREKLRILFFKEFK